MINAQVSEFGAQSSDQGLADDPPIARSAPVGILIVATIGWFLAIVAVLVLHWPLDGAQPTISGPHLLRLLGTVPGETAQAAVVRRFLDAAIYIILLIGTGLLLAVWLRRPQGALRGLAVAAFLGIVYTAGMALYTGPMIGVCGFTLTLCSTLISLAALSARGVRPIMPTPMIVDHNTTKITGSSSDNLSDLVSNTVSDTVDTSDTVSPEISQEKGHDDATYSPA